MYNDSFKKRYGTAPVAITENTAPHDTSAHIHREIELLYGLAGRALITVADRTYTAAAGDVVIVNPMDVHSVKADRAGEYHQRCICFDPALLADKAMVEALSSGECSVSGLYSREDVRELFMRLFSSVVESSEALLLESSAYASLLFASLKRAGEVTLKHKGTKKRIFSRTVQEYLAEHYTEEITSKDLASSFYYTQSYFCRLFRAEFGASFLEYLTMYRISRAKAILSQGTARISEAARAVGFSDPSYFSKCFKDVVGISPTEYQKSQFSR